MRLLPSVEVEAAAEGELLPSRLLLLVAASDSLKWFNVFCKARPLKPGGGDASCPPVAPAMETWGPLTTLKALPPPNLPTPADTSAAELPKPNDDELPLPLAGNPKLLKSLDG